MLFSRPSSAFRPRSPTTAFSASAAPSRYASHYTAVNQTIRTYTDSPQCSLSHQLLPKEQQTPPEEVCATHPPDPARYGEVLTENRITHTSRPSSRRLRLS